MTRSLPKLSAVLLACLALTPAESTDRLLIDPAPCPNVDWQLGDPSFEALEGARAFYGTYDGGIYRVEIPDTWNGDLVLYAHGYRGAGGSNGATLRVGNSPIREHLIGGGYAWAASSYRCNGYVPGHGLEDTLLLVDLFTELNEGDAPELLYLTGTSMGGHVTLLGMHEYPSMFAGGLAMCPAGPALFDFTAAVGAAAEVVTGIRFTPGETGAQRARMLEILGEPPDYTEKGRQLASVQVAISGGVRPFAMEGLESRFVSNISGAVAGGNARLDTHWFNYGVEPGLGITAETLNADARRVTGAPDVRGPDGGPYQEHRQFDGEIERPVLTMHGTGDLFVPIFLQQVLKEAVDAAGNGDLLVQRIYRIPGHCGFSQAEMTRAFDDLVAWVTHGERPAGDDVHADLADAGREFTDPLREGDPGTIGVVP